MSAGYEVRDANVRGVWYCAAGLIVAAVVIHATVFWMYDGLRQWRVDRDQEIEARSVSGDAREREDRFPQPRLQENPRLDLERFRAAEDAELSSFGWIDRQHGIARVPIDTAIEIALRRGFPQRSEGAPVPSHTLLEMQQTRASDWAKQKEVRP